LASFALGTNAGAKFLVRFIFLAETAMTKPVRILCIAALGLCALLGTARPAIQSSSQSSAVAASTDRTTVADLPPVVVRLRKMHLVRPDLIPYPIKIEVFC
jgi:hypothetical protein